MFQGEGKTTNKETIWSSINETKAASVKGTGTQVEGIESSVKESSRPTEEEKSSDEAAVTPKAKIGSVEKETIGTGIEITGAVSEIAGSSSEEYVEPTVELVESLVELEALIANKETILSPVNETISSATELIPSNVEHILFQCEEKGTQKETVSSPVKKKQSYLIESQRAQRWN